MHWKWDWSFLCGRRDANFSIWDHGDFGHCFEQVAIVCPTHVIVAVASIYHLARHSGRQISGPVPHSHTLYVRLAISLLLILLPLILILTAFIYESIHPSLIDVVTWVIRALSWLVHSAFVWKLRRFYHLHIRGPLSMFVAFLLATASMIIQLRTVIRHMVNSTTYFDVIQQYLTFITIVHHFLYTLTLIPWQRPNLQDYVSAYQAINDSTEQDVANRFRDYGSVGNLRDRLGHSEDNANLLSRLSFWWVNPIMLRGFRGEVSSTDDLFCLPKKLNTEAIDIVFTSKFRANTDSSDSSDSDVEFPLHSRITLLQALNKTFGTEYYCLGILKFLADGLGFVGPLVLNLLVTYMENPGEPTWHGYAYAGILFLATVISSILSTQFNYHISIVGMKIRAAIITTVYKKSLKVSAVNRSLSSAGNIVNYMSTDTDRIVNFCPSFHAFWSLPIQTGVSLYLLYLQVSWAFLAGLGFTIILIPINRWLAIKIGELSHEMMVRKDARVKMMSEILYGMRAIKMCAWETFFLRRIGTLRDAELHSLKGRKYLDAMCVYFWATTPVLISILTFTTYALMGHQLTAAKVFTSMALFVMLIVPLNAFPWVINGLMEAWVSLKRIGAFLQMDEIDWPSYYTNNPEVEGSAAIVIRDGDFCLTGESNRRGDVGRGADDGRSGEAGRGGDNGRCGEAGNSGKAGRGGDHGRSGEAGNSGKAGRSGEAGRDGDAGRSGEAGNSCEAGNSDEAGRSGEAPRILHSINMHISNGQFVGITGRTGSGKSSLLSAIQGELLHIAGVVYVADLQDGFGFATQEPWLQHATVRENILFGQPYHADFYESVLSACALDEDLKMLPSGDRTEVGENGITLSGGQKARIALARAVYQDKTVYLLDDPLAAVDAHVARHLYQHCIMGLLRHKTRILCTHHVEFLQDADLVVVMENDSILKSGSPDEVLREVDWITQRENAEAAPEDTEAVDPDEEQPQDEERETGVVRLHVYASYWQAVGPVLASMVLLALFLMQASRNVTDWWLSYWVTHSHSRHQQNTSIVYTDSPRLDVLEPWSNVSDSAQDNIRFYLTVYGGLALGNSIFTCARAFLFAYGGICAAKCLHSELLNNIVKAPMSFFCLTPIGRILNRFSSDIYAVDDSLPFILNIFLAQLYGVLGTLVITCYGLPWFVLVLVPLGTIYYFIQRYYRCTSREIKRLSSVTLSPIYAHFSETLMGLSTIRALRAVPRFEHQNRMWLENNQRAQYAGQAASQWLGIRLQAIGVAMVTCVAMIAVIEHQFHTVNAGLVGLALSYALSVTGLLNGVVTFFTETEKQMVSVERIRQYTDDVPQERDWASLNAPPYWPIQGHIIFSNVTIQYQPRRPPALNNICLEIQPAEKIGIVGRTGSGKSSLFSAIFQMVPLQNGQIIIDGINTQHLPLDTLRSRMSIIPQDPFLFSGSVRENLDPQGLYADHEVEEVLRACHIDEAVHRHGGLYGDTGQRGHKFSVGQRQLLCLARSLLSRAKILCIDEATASVDRETDALIQQTIRREFRDQTVLTIAHRVNTILDSDRVIVMDSGQVMEFSTPNRLLANSHSIFYSLVHGHVVDNN